MSDFARQDVSMEDIDTNASGNPTFDTVLQARLSRRSLLKGSLGYAVGSFIGGGMMNASAIAAPVAGTSLKLDFHAVAKNLEDKVTVPEGYGVTVLYRLGDPIAAGVPAYRNDGSEAGDSFDHRAGDHHDGMHFFGLGGNDKYSPNTSHRGLLVMNHESITPAYLHVNGQSRKENMRPVADEVIKEMKVHGVSIVEIGKHGKVFTYKQDSRFNRRITTLTPIMLAGPAAGARMITAYSPDGTMTRGTVNNCANGHTPWGTYLTCEENWAGFFRRGAGDTRRTKNEQTSFARYGIPLGAEGNHLWATVTPDDAQKTFSRWNVTRTGTSDDGSDDFRHVANTYGWVVEIDPFAPDSTPKKRTSLGRFGHENVSFQPAVAGRPLVCYMGDDAKGEYIYKYVSDAVWDAADAHNPDAGDKYLNKGKLYAARFDADGSGTWLELSFGVNGITSSNSTYAFADQADVLINARLAADVAGATRMDRPEWVGVNPANGEAYVTLTNNDKRTLASADAANPRYYNDPKGSAAQRGNPNGHIIRWKDAAPTATVFQWDVFLFGARSTADAARINLSQLSADNDFSSPDGLWFARSGLLWIETDDNAYTDVTNCMLLAAVPGAVGDGGKKTIANTDGDASRNVATYVGTSLGDARLRRFLVGPKECEITGMTETPDGRALFINIQHPGEVAVPDFRDPASFGSHWPDGGAARPRSATIVITKNDGGPVGGSFA